MNLAQALRFNPLLQKGQKTSPNAFSIEGFSPVALVGAGGKTTALFQIARQLPSPVMVSATTHLGISQLHLADTHTVVHESADLVEPTRTPEGVNLITGPIEGQRTLGLDETSIDELHSICEKMKIPLLIEADGSHQKPVKAPADHEPPIPAWVRTVLVVIGLSCLGKPLDEKNVHRPEIFARLCGIKMGDLITSESLVRLAIHPSGGLKNMPAHARRIVLLNQADDPALCSEAKWIAERLLGTYDAVITGSLDLHSERKINESQIHAVYEPVAAVILAAGAARRFGSPKALLEWQGKPFIKVVTEAALSAGLAPVLVVSGANAEQVIPAVKGLPATIIHNDAWQSGQSSSIKAALAALQQTNQRASKESHPSAEGSQIDWKAGAAIFLLVDQPMITPAVLRALVDAHSRSLAPIIAPQVKGQRANPVLFDRATFADLNTLQGDIGGRAIFARHKVEYLDWLDEGLLIDIDTPGQYQALMDEK